MCVININSLEAKRAIPRKWAGFSFDDVTLAMQRIFFVNFGDGSWQQAEAWILLLAEVNPLAQAALRQSTHMAVDWTPNLLIKRRTLYHWAIAAAENYVISYAVCKFQFSQQTFDLILQSYLDKKGLFDEASSVCSTILFVVSCQIKEIITSFASLSWLRSYNTYI